MATRKQVQAAKRNVKKAQSAARSKRTIAHLPAATRSDLGRQAAKSRARDGRAGRNLEDRTREQLYELARRRNIRGRSKMRKWDLVRALRRS
ncbi:MAG TPA: hypothetical protein VFK76_09750 [Gaiellaceae bacterium]|nr:hypothetical protein [Gaiellaceae bacterium]